MVRHTTSPQPQAVERKEKNPSDESKGIREGEPQKHPQTKSVIKPKKEPFRGLR